METMRQKGGPEESISEDDEVSWHWWGGKIFSSKALHDIATFPICDCLFNQCFIHRHKRHS